MTITEWYDRYLAHVQLPGIYRGGLVQPTTDNGAVDVWTEEELVGQIARATDPDSPWLVREPKCDMGCHSVGDTHYESCRAFDPNQKVKF